MNEWSVVGVLVVLLSLVGGIARPIISLNNTITRLATLLETIAEDLETYARKNDASHDRLWEHNSKQDSQLKDHDRRITVLEVKDTR